MVAHTGTEVGDHTNNWSEMSLPSGIQKLEPFGSVYLVPSDASKLLRGSVGLSYTRILFLCLSVDSDGKFPRGNFTAERILSFLILRVNKGMEESPQESSEEIFLDPHYHYD